MKFPRIHADEQGETHIGDRDVPQHEARVGPPPNPLGKMTETEAVSTFVAFSAPAGTEVPSHNAPQPCICIVLAGEGEVEASDGTTLRPGPGELIYCDDVSGKGHVTRSITDVRLAFINRTKA
jgi:quercetin dioxygenase-like cupin family protein